MSNDKCVLCKVMKIDVEDNNEARYLEIRENNRKEFLKESRNVLSIAQDNNVALLIDNLKEYARLAGDFSCPQNQLESLKKLRNLLTYCEKLPIDDVINAGFLPILSHCISFGNNEKIHLEAAWIITNLATGNSQQTNKIVEANCVPYLINLLSSNNYALREQAIWALGNIIGDSPKLRDHVLGFNIFKPIIKQIKQSTPISFIRLIAWITLNLCRHREVPLNVVQTKSILKAIAVLILQTDTKVLFDLLWATSLITEIDNEHIQKVIESGLISRIINLTAHSDTEIKLNALYVIGNITTGTNGQIQFILRLNVLYALRNLLSISNEEVRKTIFWIISNITAGDQEQIQELIDTGFFYILIQELQSGTFTEKKEILWCIQNITINRSKEINIELIAEGVIPALCELTDYYDSNALQLVLESLKDIFETCPDKIVEIKEEPSAFSNIIESLKKIRRHESSNISFLAEYLLFNYFD